MFLRVASEGPPKPGNRMQGSMPAGDQGISQRRPHWSPPELSHLGGTNTVRFQFPRFVASRCLALSRHLVERGLRQHCVCTPAYLAFSIIHVVTLLALSYFPFLFPFVHQSNNSNSSGPHSHTMSFTNKKTQLYREDEKAGGTLLTPEERMNHIRVRMAPVRTLSEIMLTD